MTGPGPVPLVEAPSVLPLNVAALLRVVLTSVGGGLVQHGVVTDAGWQTDSGVLMLVAAIVWVLVQNDAHVKAFTDALLANPIAMMDKSGKIIFPPGKGPTP